MWFLFTVIPLIMLAVPIALVMAIVTARRLGSLRRDFDALSQQVARLQPVPAMIAPQQPVPESAPHPVADVQLPTAAAAPAAPAISRPEPAPEAAEPVTPTPPSRPLDLEAILGGQWLTWIGVLALFCGSAFFLGVDLGESPFAGLPQILIGLAAAVAFNLVGRYCSVRRERFLGLGLLGGGVALLYLAAYAAYGFHHLVPLSLVFPLLLVVATAGALLALDRNSVAIASLTLVGAFLTPVLLSGGENPTYGLLPYLVAVNLGAVLVGLRRGWAGLPLGAFVATLVLVSGWFSLHDDPSLRLYAFACLTGSWLVFFVAPWLRPPKAEFWSLARGLVLAGNGLFYALLCYQLLDGGGEHLRGAMLLVLAVIYLGVSRWMQRRQGDDHATRMTHWTGVALAAVAIPVQLDLAWVTLGWTALAVILLQTGIREGDRWHRFSGLAVLALVMVRSLIIDLPQMHATETGFRPVLNGEFLTGLVFVAVLGWLAWAYRRHADRLTTGERRLWTPLLILAVIAGVWKLSFELMEFFTWREQRLGVDQEATGLLSLTLLWAVCGAIVVVTGVRSRLRPLRLTGDYILGVSLLVTVIATLSYGHRLVATYHPLANLPFLHGVVITAILAGLFWWLQRARDGAPLPASYYRAPLLIAAIMLLFLKVSFEVTAYFSLGVDPDLANQAVRSVLTLSLVWAVYAGAVVVSGFVARYKPLRILGILLLAVTVLKVFVVDMQALDRGYRIVAFVALGLLLLAISVLYQRERKDKAEDRRAA